MKWTTCIIVSTLIIGFTIFIGCSNKTSDKIGFGTIENETYINEFFGMTAKLPKEWHALNEEAKRKLMQDGINFLAEKDNTFKEVDINKLNTVSLFAAFKHPIGSPDTFNPSLICFAEKVNHFVGIENGGNYLYQMNHTMKMSQINCVFPRDIYLRNIDGIDFYVQEVEINLGSVNVRQKLYATIMRGYALVFCISTNEKQDEEWLEQTIAKASFNII